MKFNLQKITFCLLFILIFGSAKAQTIATFENLNLSSNTYWNGKDFSGGFTSGTAYFENYFDSTYGDYWEGFAVSTTTNDTSGTYLNQYSAITAKGYNNSKSYALMYKNGILRLTGSAMGKQVGGFYITNSTYAYSDMQNGSSFSKKFGGLTGDDPDFFKVIIGAWKNGVVKQDSIAFFLADYRFPDHSKDYILKTWSWLDLTKLGDVDSLRFYFLSSDTGTYGINTPQYFCMDNFTTLDIKTGIHEIHENGILSVYPNPAITQIHLSLNREMKEVCILNLQGEILINGTGEDVDISSLTEGIYLLQVLTDKGMLTQRFIKQ